MIYVNIILYLVQENTSNYIDVPKKRGTSITPKTVYVYNQNIWITHLNLL